MDSRRVKITEHALVQLGRRYGLAPTKAELRAMLANAVPLFTTASGQAIGFESSIGLVFGVLRHGALVTVITPEMAFADCPQSVFHYLISQGHLVRALALRAAWHAGRLPSPSSTASPHPNDLVVWSAFARHQRKARR